MDNDKQAAGASTSITLKTAMAMLMLPVLLLAGCTAGAGDGDDDAGEAEQAGTAQAGTPGGGGEEVPQPIGSGDSKLLEILDRGSIRVGVPGAAPPFGFLDDENQPAGFDIEMAKLMAEQLGVELELVEIELPNRVPLLVSGRVDVMSAAMAPTAERAKSVSFSEPYAWSGMNLMAPADTELSGLDDLDGRRLGLARGTTCDTLISAKASGAVDVSRYEGPADVFNALATDKVDAVCESSLTIADQIENFHPEWEIKGNALMWIPASFGVPLGDHLFVDWLDVFIAGTKHDGTLQELYAEWFGLPFPTADALGF